MSVEAIIDRHWQNHSNVIRKGNSVEKTTDKSVEGDRKKERMGGKKRNSLQARGKKKKVGCTCKKTKQAQP